MAILRRPNRTEELASQYGVKHSPDGTFSLYMRGDPEQEQVRDDYFLPSNKSKFMRFGKKRRTHEFLKAQQLADAAKASAAVSAGNKSTDNNTDDKTDRTKTTPAPTPSSNVDTRYVSTGDQGVNITQDQQGSRPEYDYSKLDLKGYDADRFGEQYNRDVKNMTGWASFLNPSIDAKTTDEALLETLRNIKETGQSQDALGTKWFGEDRSKWGLGKHILMSFIPYVESQYNEGLKSDEDVQRRYEEIKRLSEEAGLPVFLNYDTDVYNYDVEGDAAVMARRWASGLPFLGIQEVPIDAFQEAKTQGKEFLEANGNVYNVDENLQLYKQSGDDWEPITDKYYGTTEGTGFAGAFQENAPAMLGMGTTEKRDREAGLFDALMLFLPASILNKANKAYQLGRVAKLDKKAGSILKKQQAAKKAIDKQRLGNELNKIFDKQKLYRDKAKSNKKLNALSFILGI